MPKSTRFPTITEVAAEIQAVKAEALKLPIADDLNGVEVRLQVYPDGRWALRTGDPGYDTDHHGFWASATVYSRHSNCPTNVRECAKFLLEQCRDDAAMSETV